MCGINEYTTPSTPPKKYRIQTIDGGWCDNDRAGSCFGDTLNADRQNYSGSYIYSPDDCSQQNNQASVYGHDPSGVLECDEVPQFPTTQPAKNFVPTETFYATLTETSTKRTWAYDHDCNEQGPGVWRTIRGTVTSELSDEDTESAAITRLLAGPEGTWGPYLAGTPTSCLASWEIRDDFDFEYQEAQFMISKSGLRPGKLYLFKADVFRSPSGEDDFVKVDTLHFSGRADQSGNFQQVDIGVPIERGFDTYISVGVC